MNDKDNSAFAQLIALFPTSTGICTDSRKLSRGNIFFALKGDNFDGNSFAAKALEEGAICAVVDNGCGCSDKCFEVESPLRMFQALSKWYRSTFSIPIIGLTGTNGKTTTKELITEVLSKKYKITSTVGNLNNSIGVPLTLFSLTKESQIAVVEMGASHPGDIKELVELVCPDYGLITNVGKAHLLGFGSFEGVKKTKGELYDYLQEHNGVAFVNVDNPNLKEMINSRSNLKTIKYGRELFSVKVLNVTSANPYLRIEVSTPKGEEVIIETHLVGAYNADNVLAALTIGYYFGVSFTDAIDAISNYSPSNNRSQLIKTDNNLLVMDAYNANPTSMSASLKNFKETSFDHKMLILGDMRELGADSDREHRAIFDYVLTMGVEKAFFVGEEFISLQGEDARGEEFLFFSNVEQLKEFITANPISGQTILVKGSNGIRLQSIIGNL